MSAWAELNILTSKQIKQFFENKKLRKPVNRGGRPNKTPITVINGRRVRQRALPVLALAALLLASPVLCFAALLLRCFGCFAAFAPVAPLRIFNRAVCCAVQNLRGWQSSAPLRLWLTRLDRDLAGALVQGLWRERSLQAHQASKQLPRVPLSSWFLRRLPGLFTTRRTNTRMLRRERLLSSRLPRCRSIASAHHILGCPRFAASCQSAEHNKKGNCH